MPEDPVLNTLAELKGAFVSIKRAKKLHSLAERRLASLLAEAYPEGISIPEPGEIPGGRSDLAYYFQSGFYVVFELFATISQVPQDLRHLEQSNANARIAILTDKFLDEGRIHLEYFRKRPRDPFPWIDLSDVLVIEKQDIAIAKIRHLIDQPLQEHLAPQANAENPDLYLKFFQESGIYKDEISLNQNPQLPNQRMLFNLALVNRNVASPPAEGIVIKVDTYWSGNELSKSPKINGDRHRRTTPGWSSRRSAIKQRGDISLPSILVYSGADLCTPGVGIEWSRFSIEFQEKAYGTLLMFYIVNSSKPHTSRRGDLAIYIA